MNVSQELDDFCTTVAVTPAVFREMRALRESPAKAYRDLTGKPDRTRNETDNLSSEYRTVSRPP